MEENNHSGHFSGNNSVDSEEILENAVSFSSAVVSDDERYNSHDLLMIAPPTSVSPTTPLGGGSYHSYDPRTVIPPLTESGVKKELLLKPKMSLGGGGGGGGPDHYYGDDDEQDSLLSTLRPTLKREKLTYFGFTKRQWAILVVFGVANVLATTAISIQAPFYPQEAEKKGATATEYGFVFGVYQLVMFVMSPVFGSLIGKPVPAKLMFNLGIFVTGICAIIFGFLDYIEGRALFITLSFIIRIIQSCGDSAYVTASFTIIAMEFPDSVATTFAALETCSGIGLIIGPTIGGALFEVGGFLLPFVTIGGILIVAGIFTLILLPSSVSSDTVLKGAGFVSLVKIPVVAMAILGVIVGSLGIGFLSGTLEPHVRAHFNLTPLYTGLVFIIEGGMYALSAPLWGRICDKISQPKLVMLIGCVLCFTGFLLIGPAPFMPFSPTLWVTCVGLGVFGLGGGATLVSGFIQMLQDALARGFPDSISTYGLVSGLWTSAFAFGCFVGPSVGGVLLDNFGFEYASVFVLAIAAIGFFVVLAFYCTARPRNQDGTDRDPLRLNETVSFGKADSQMPSTSKSYGTLP